MIRRKVDYCLVIIIFNMFLVNITIKIINPVMVEKLLYTFSAVNKKAKK